VVMQFGRLLTAEESRRLMAREIEQQMKAKLECRRRDHASQEALRGSISRAPELLPRRLMRS
jgi:hypothetical protein